MIDFAVRMQHLSLTMLADDAPTASIELARLQVVHLIETTPDEKLLSKLPALDYQQIFLGLNSRFQKISQYFEDDSLSHVRDCQPVSMENLRQASEKARQLWLKISEHEEKIRAAKDGINLTRQLQGSLERFKNLDLDLGKLARESLFIKVFIGTVPTQERQQLDRALSLDNTVIEAFHQADTHDYVTVITARDKHQDTQEILKSAGFHSIDIPSALQSHPETVRRHTEAELARHQQTIDQENSQIMALISAHGEELQNIQRVLSGARPYANLAASLSGKGEIVHLEGWVPKGQESSLRNRLDETLEYPYLLSLREPETDELHDVPFMPRKRWLMKPFRALVGQYGIPEYGEIDPTRLFAYSYILMFGMMFGDIGHGAVIILIGLLLRKKISGLATFTTLAGLSSIIFGFLYGSVFGYHIIHPLWMSPMEDPSRMLVLSLYWGIGFLVITYLLSIYNSFALGQPDKAIYSNRGIAGLVLFAGSVFAGYQYMVNQRFGVTELLAIALPLSVVLYKHWQHMDGSIAEKMLLIVIEALDNLINILSSTLSFLRVAAFSLNHVALALAVFTLAAMMDTFGHVVTVILGNAFIIVLEGGIVAIQCLRLEYYEGFSRFFSGRGRKFDPLKLETLR